MTAELKQIDLKTRDKYARQFNAETDMEKKLELLKKIKLYDDKLSAWFKKNNQRDEKHKKLNALFESIEEQRKREYEK